MRLRVLGGLELRDADGEPVALPGRRNQALLCVLAMSADRPVVDERIIDALWPDADGPNDPAGSVRTYVTRLRSTVGSDLIDRVGGGYRLRLEPSELDVAVFERRVHEGVAALAAGDPERAATELHEAIRLWRGPPWRVLAGWAEADADAVRCEELHAHAQEQHAAGCLAAGRPDEATGALSALVAVNPLREQRWMLLMTALEAAGRHADALRAYESFRRHLADELGLDPSPRLRGLQTAILNHQPLPPVVGVSSPTDSAKAAAHSEPRLKEPSRERAATGDTASPGDVRADGTSATLLGVSPGPPAAAEAKLDVHHQRPDHGPTSRLVTAALPPHGTVTFLFTDVEGSTRLWEEHPEAMRAALAAHDRILRSVIEEHQGYVFSTAGDAFAAAFWTADEAILAAVEGQRRLREATWPNSVVLPVRMGIHTGTADERDGDYFGPAVNRAARLMGAAHGSQIVCSSVTAEMASSDLAGGVTIQRLGTYRLKDLLAPEIVLQVNGPGPVKVFPPLRSLDLLRHNLPVQHTRLVGRVEEIASVIEQLGRARVVTLTGIGGCGKTRLALAVAAELAPAYEGGVFFVSLADKPGGGVVEAITQSMGVRLASLAPRDVAAFVAAQNVLLVLDNCEHVVDEVANLVEHVLARGPSCRLLITSREALSVRSEHVVRVPSLRVDATAEDGGVSPAAELFLDRARAAGLHAGVTPEAEAVLGEVCRRLDGIPLAIELAAAQLSVLSPLDLLDRLDRRFDVLVADRRRQPQRQQALQAMMNWSWELLTSEEQRLLAVVSVFTGQWSLEAAEALGRPHVSGAVTGVLQRLVAKSLVEPVFGPGRRRFRLLETVRLYAAARLQELGLADDVRAEHVGLHLRRARQVGAERALADLDSLDATLLDLNDLDATIAWCATHSAWSDAAELVVLAGGIWTRGIQVASGVRWVRLLEARLDNRGLRARLLAIGGFAAGVAGQYDTTRRWAREALDLALGCDHFAAAVAALLEAAPNILTDPDTAARYLLDARAAAEEQGSPELAGLVQQWINMAVFCEPDLDLPVMPTDDAAAFGGPRSLGWALARSVAALNVAENGDYEAALSLLPTADSAIRTGTPEEKWYRITVEALAGNPALVLGEAGALVVEVNRFSDVTGHAELVLILGIALARSARWADALEHIEVAKRAPMTFPFWYALARRFGRQARSQLQASDAEAIVERARSSSVDEFLRRQLR